MFALCVGIFMGSGQANAATPDWSGLDATHYSGTINSTATAHAIIDSVIAAQQMRVGLSPEWAVIGQSQGAAAALNSARWAAEFSAGRGLDFRGLVATGTPATMSELVASAGPDLETRDLGRIVNAYMAYILAALGEAHPELAIDTVLTSAGQDAVDAARTVCVEQLSQRLAAMRVSDFFTAPLSSVPGLTDALEDYMGTPTSGFDRPIFLGVGLHDTDVPPSSTLNLYDQLVANHQDVVLRTYPGDDHHSTVLASLADSTPFLHSIFDARN